MPNLYTHKLCQNRLYNISERRTLLSWLFITLFAGLLWLGMAGPAQAGVSGYKSKTNSADIFKLTLKDVTGVQDVKLDYVGPEFELGFHLPENAQINDLELLLSAHPQNQSVNDAPLLVNFNFGQAIPLHGRGRSFDARIKLEPSQIKPGLNTLRFTYKPMGGETCLSAKNGAWDIDMSASKIIMKTRTKVRGFHMSEIKSRLNSDATAPKKAALIVKGAGPDALKWQALAAQGLSLNMDKIPTFTRRSGRSDIELYIGTRRKLEPLLASHNIALAPGPQIAVINNKPLRLALTGASEQDVTQMLKAFAKYELPASRRHFSAAGEFVMQKQFKNSFAAADNRQNLDALSPYNMTRSWSPQARLMRFDIDDPLASRGQLNLKLRAGNTIDSRSSVNFSLNGKNLGKVALTSSRVKTKIDIPAGLFRAVGNELVMTPNLMPKAMAAPNAAQLRGASCTANRSMSGFGLAEGSHLGIFHDPALSAIDLSRLAASGFPFTVKDGLGTQVIVPARSEADFSASMRVLAQLARAYGSGWIEAEFSTDPAHINDSLQVIIIGPNIDQQTSVMKHAPLGLVAALNGRPARPAMRGKQNGNSAAPIKLLKMTTNAPRGGVAALYAGQPGSEQIIAVLTNSRGQSFSRAMNALITPDHWNSLQGSVMRWDRQTAAMSQTAQIKLTDMARFRALAKPQTSQSSSLFGLDIGLPNFNKDAVRSHLITAKNAAAKGLGDTLNYFKDAGHQARREFDGFLASTFERRSTKVPARPAQQIKPSAPQIKSSAPSSRPIASKTAASYKTTGYKTSTRRKLSPYKAPSYKPASANPAPALPQYRPNAARRAVKTSPAYAPPLKTQTAIVAAPPKTNMPTGPQTILTKAGQLTRSLYQDFSAYITRKIRQNFRYMTSQNTGEPSQAKVLSFAIIALIFLILMALIRPITRR